MNNSDSIIRQKRRESPVLRPMQEIYRLIRERLRFSSALPKQLPTIRLMVKNQIKKYLLLQS